VPEVWAMTIKDFEEWIKSAWRISEQSGRSIEEYEVRIHGMSITDISIDHGTDTLDIT